MKTNNKEKERKLGLINLFTEDNIIKEKNMVKEDFFGRFFSWNKMNTGEIFQMTHFRGSVFTNGMMEELIEVIGN